MNRVGGQEWRALAAEAGNRSGHVSDPASLAHMLGCFPVIHPGHAPWLTGASLMDYEPGVGGGAFIFVLSADRSGSGCVRQGERDQPAAWPRIDSRPVSELVATIKATLGLSVKDTASVLRVERPTVYAWMRNASVPQQGNRERLAEVAEIADLWLEIGGGEAPPDLRAPGAGGNTLLDLLKDQYLRKWLIEQTLRRQAAERAHRQPPRISLRERARQKGYAQQADEHFDVMTGRRLGPEA